MLAPISLKLEVDQDQQIPSLARGKQFEKSMAKIPMFERTRYPFCFHGKKTVSLQGPNVQRQSYTILHYLPIWNRRNVGMDDLGSAPCKSPTRNHIRHSTSTLSTWNPQLPEHAISSHSSVAPFVYLEPKWGHLKPVGSFLVKFAPRHCNNSYDSFCWITELNVTVISFQLLLQQNKK